jgi:N-acetylmuramoyl-L-alanine amidase
MLTQASAETAAPAAAPVPTSFPIASDARIAGDDHQTRLIVDLDGKVPLRAFALADPYRVVIDLPQVNFRLPKGTGESGRGLIKAFRYGLVMPGGSRIVLDLTGPAKIAKAEILDPANGQPGRMVIDLESIDRAAFMQALQTAENVAELRPTVPGTETTATVSRSVPLPKVETDDPRPVVVIDPGHGGIDNGTQSADGVAEKTIVLDFAVALRDRLAQQGKFRVDHLDPLDLFGGEVIELQRISAAEAVAVDIHRRAPVVRREAAQIDLAADAAGARDRYARNVLQDVE